MQKAYSLQLNSRDRLQRQITDLKLKGQSIINKDPAGLVESLSDESAQLESEREQLQNRIAAIMSKPRLAGNRSGTQQHDPHSDTTVCRTKNHETARGEPATGAANMLLHERSQFAREKVTDGEDLQRQLKQVTADHAALMNLR